MSYRVNRGKKLGDDAENNTAVASAGSNNNSVTTGMGDVAYNVTPIPVA